MTALQSRTRARRVTTLKSSKLHWLGLIKGGPGSGNHGHCGGDGGPGNPGGSKPAGECGTSTSSGSGLKLTRADALSDEFYEWLEEFTAGRTDVDQSQWYRFRASKKIGLLGEGRMAIDYKVGSMSNSDKDRYTRDHNLGLSFFGRHKQTINRGLLGSYETAIELMDAMPDDYSDKKVSEVFLDVVEDGIKKGQWAYADITKENELDAIMAMAESVAPRLDRLEEEAKDYWAKGAGKIDMRYIRHGGKASVGDGNRGAQPAMEALMEARAKHLMGPEGNFDEAKKNYSAYWKDWLIDSQSPLGHWLAHVASKELGAPSKMRGPIGDDDIGGEYAGVKDFLARAKGGMQNTEINDTRYRDDAAMVRATWEVSQLALRDEPENMTLFRGIKPREDAEVDFTATEDENLFYKTDIMLKSSALQSSSTSFSSASAFGTISSEHPLRDKISDIIDSRDDDGARMPFSDPALIVGVDLPKSKIFSVPSFGANDAGEEEYVILGGDWDNNAKVYLIGLGNSDRLSHSDAEKWIAWDIRKAREKRDKINSSPVVRKGMVLHV